MATVNWTYPFPGGGWYVPGYAIGGGGGSGFIICEFDASKVVRKVGVNYSSKYLRGIRVNYNDDTRSVQIGSASDSYKEITLQPAERITSASLWGNGVGTRCGRIRFSTDKGQTLDAGKNTSGQTEYPIDVGSGILAGFCGRASADIDALSFVILKPVASVVLSNVSYTAPPPNTIRPVNLTNDVTYTNGGSVPVDFDFSNSVQRTNTCTFTSEATMTFGMSVTVSAGIPEIAQVETGFNWEVSETHSRSVSTSESVTLSWGLRGTLQPGQRVVCSATCQYGTADVSYSARVTINFKSGASKSYTERGLMQNTQYAFATASVREIKMASAAKIEARGMTEINGDQDVEWLGDPLAQIEEVLVA